MSTFLPQRPSDVIQNGDTVIVYMSPESLQAVVVAEEGQLLNRFGAFPYKDMIGRPWGWQLHSTNGRGFVYLLHPTAELWTQALPHRTQILYMTDIAVILSMLEVRAGSVVVESGTGSGSFSHSLARAIGGTGHLYTFEYHKERADRARIEFDQHGLGERVTTECKDVCKEGFGLEGVADAVFLDLPAPWEALPSAVRTFKAETGGRIACFSPCIEQVQRTCGSLHQNGFRDIRLFEALIRPHEVRQMKILGAPVAATALGLEMPPIQTHYTTSRPLASCRGHTSYLTFATLSPRGGEGDGSGR